MQEEFKHLTDAECLSFMHVDPAVPARMAQISSADNVGTSITRSREVASMQVRQWDGNEWVEATAITTITNGFRLNFPTNVNAAAKKWPYLAARGH